mmetsp:Transcript_11217/g.19663  ORF Transcript_11217/g.19663 Transcript_11217/m.19663 type:complete len:278 (+) Transcript_11217:507-1340(+)
MQLLIDTLEHMVVQIPSLMQFCFFSAAPIVAQPLVCLIQLPPISLHECNFSECGGPCLLHHVVQRQQHGQHALHIALPKVETRGLLQALMPHLHPKDGHANELLADQLGLLYQIWGVLSDAVQHCIGSCASTCALALGGHQQGIHQCLWVMSSNLDQERVDETAHSVVVGVDARNDLWDDNQPCVNGDECKALLQGLFHVFIVPIVEPQGEEAQNILQVACAIPCCLAQGNRPEESSNSRRHTAQGCILVVAPSVMQHDCHIEQRPLMPCLGPVGRS